METPARSGETTVNPSPPTTAPIPVEIVEPVKPAAKPLSVAGEDNEDSDSVISPKFRFQKLPRRPTVRSLQSNTPQRGKSQLQLLVIGRIPWTVLGHLVTIKSLSITNLTAKPVHHGRQLDKECVAQLKAVVLAGNGSKIHNPSSSPRATQQSRKAECIRSGWSILVSLWSGHCARTAYL